MYLRNLLGTVNQFRLAGESGITQPCLIALESALAGPAPVQKVTVLTNNGREHLFLLWESFDRPYFGAIIPSGFKSGYAGEGGRGFSLALCMIHELQIPIEHLKVRASVFDRIDGGDFPVAWQRQVSESASPLEMPIGGWVFNNHWQLLTDRRLWRVQGWKRRNSPVRWQKPAIDVDKFSWDVGDKLFIASEYLTRNAQPENCQKMGLMLRDAWIEFTGKARLHSEEIDEGIGKNDVKRVLDELRLTADIAAKAKKSYSRTLNLQHDRGAEPQAAERCFNETVEAMAEIIEMCLPGVSDPRRHNLISTN